MEPGRYSKYPIIWKIWDIFLLSYKINMLQQYPNLSPDVTTFLDTLNHPFRIEIEALRSIILGADQRLTENIKWNSPNYCLEEADRITMKIQPPKQVQLIFHRGAKVQEQPKEKLINDNAGLLVWKGNDRAVATFKSMADIEKNKATLAQLVKGWIDVTT